MPPAAAPAATVPGAPLTVAVTGSEGFIGRHVVEALGRRAETRVLGLDVGTSPEDVRETLLAADAVIHLAGVNRPESPEEFESGNAGFTGEICRTLAEAGRTPLVIFTSSTQAALDNPYGLSKRKAEEALQTWAGTIGAPVVIFRLPNAFGKWARPFYNSAVATFCHQAAHGLPLTVNDSARELDLVYIDDVVAALLHCLDAPPSGFEQCTVDPVYRATVGDVADRIAGFPRTRNTLLVPDFSDPLTARLYATYLSHLDGRDLAYSLRTSTDARGSLAEFVKQPRFGQLFVSRTAPGVTRGNHYHHTKVEKFLVVEGEAVIRFRDVRGGPLVEHRVDGHEFRVVDIPPGLSHSIENVGAGELVTLFWANEVFDPERPDTHPFPVLEEEQQ
ncbi:MAG: polysaccharide biosynthesis C-terminal domain-containing protein [Thermoleophilia bacterium]